MIQAITFLVQTNFRCPCSGVPKFRFTYSKNAFLAAPKAIFIEFTSHCEYVIVLYKMWNGVFIMCASCVQCLFSLMFQ